MAQIPQGSEDYRRLNPHIFGVRSVQAEKPKHNADKALARTSQKCTPVAQGLAICVSLVVLSRRLMDSDNLSGSCKSLRDAIAASLGIDDGDEAVTWEYGQMRTDGEQGVLVKIQLTL
jgi:hypothetical protein